MLRHSSLIALFSLFALVLAACGSQEKKPTQDVLLAKRAFGHMERLRQAYSSRDMNGLKALSSKKAYASIAKRMKKFRSVKLEFVYDWVNIKANGTIEIQVGWTGNWSLAGEGTEVARKGKAAFLLGGKPMRLNRIQGTSPFAAP